MTSRAIVLFDGFCHLCDTSVRTIAANDPTGRFAFAALDSDAARTALAPFGREGERFESIVLIDEAGISIASDAALRIACYLASPWPLLAIFFAIPRGIRDRIYAWIASNRYRWFGRRDTCALPTAALRARFL